MNHPAIVAPELWHADALVPLMAPPDRLALERVSGGNPEAVLRKGITTSRYAFVGIVGDVPLCLGGLIETVPGREGVGWLVVQPGIEKYKRFFLVESRRQIAHILTLVPVLHNAERNCEGRGRRWLQWLGFEIGERQMIAGLDYPAIPITARAEHGR